MGTKIINSPENLSVNTVTDADKNSIFQVLGTYFLKKGFLLLVLLMFLAAIPVFANNSVVRVGLTDNKFQNILKQQTVVYGTDECTICDKATVKTRCQGALETERECTNRLSAMEMMGY